MGYCDHSTKKCPIGKCPHDQKVSEEIENIHIVYKVTLGDGVITYIPGADQLQEVFPRQFKLYYEYPLDGKGVMTEYDTKDTDVTYEMLANFVVSAFRGFESNGELIEGSKRSDFFLYSIEYYEMSEGLPVFSVGIDKIV